MGRNRVILADDNIDIRRRLVQILAAEYDVVAALENGEQLVAVAKILKPDLLVVDVSMPLLNGLDALQRLRLEGIHAKTVVVSANGSPAYVRRAFEMGATGYVLKGTGAKDLPVALKTVLHGGHFVSPAIDYTGHLDLEMAARATSLQT